MLTRTDVEKIVDDCWDVCVTDSHEPHGCPAGFYYLDYYNKQVSFYLKSNDDYDDFCMSLLHELIHMRTVDFGKYMQPEPEIEEEARRSLQADPLIADFIIERFLKDSPEKFKRYFAERKDKTEEQ